MTPADELARMFTDIAKLHAAALRRLADASPGFPSGHDGTGGGSTQPERFEATMGDDAVRDLAKLKHAQKRAHQAGLDMWGICTKWGVARDARSLEVADPEDEMWCRSCMTIGHFSTRRISGGVNCDWCATTLRELNTARGNAGKRPMADIPKPALHAHAMGKRISIRDLERWAGVSDIRRERNDRRKAKVENTDGGIIRMQRHESFMRSTVTCGACLQDLPVPDGSDSRTVLAEHHQGGCAA